MTQVLKLTICILLLVIPIFISCKKELDCYDCKENKPPIANAGRDTTLTLPKDSVLLDGSASTDPDGTITSYKWAKIAGPVSANIAQQNSPKTIVKSLLAGVYQFELTVTDNGGLSAKDTVQVMVNNPGVNQPPIACAGADQTITLPTNTVNLDGSCSTDPDNNITTYAWSKISGPVSFNMANANAVQTQVSNLVQGVYQIELKVTDAGGLFSKDTIQITVNATLAYTCGDTNRPHMNAQLLPIGTLSQARFEMAVASADNKIVFAGGYAANGGFNVQSSRVDIYDLTSQSWATAELCAARSGMAAVATSSKIFFAGGEVSDGTWPVDSVDIYDAAANTWRVTHLSLAGNSIAGAAVGSKVLFAGGEPGFSGTNARYSRVDIYNLTTNTWSTTSLSEDKQEPSAVTSGNKIYFAGGSNGGGVSKKIDIYDNVTNTWSTSLLTEGKIEFAAIAVGDKIYWAGGATKTSLNSCVVEIRNVNTGSSSIQQLFSPARWYMDGGQNAVEKNGKIVFLRHQETTNKFDIYDIATNTWLIGVLPVTIEEASIISVNNIIYVAGGKVNGVLSNKVWKLEF